MIRFGFAREEITPALGIPLCGYFEPRPNTGVLDPLFVKAALFESDGVVSGIVNYDLCLVPHSLVRQFQEAVAAAGLTFGKNLIFCVTHTHTGPYAGALFDGPVDREYVQELTAKTVLAIRHAFNSLSDAELYTGKSSCGTLAFNRRFWMKDGTVLTNPGKLNPEIVKSEGHIDPEIPILAVKQQGLYRMLLVSISNHADTIGGDKVSADWPGRMERAIQDAVGYDVPVVMYLGCQGNINHFNVENDVDQTNYQEACRIGKGYAAEIVSQLYALKKADIQKISVHRLDIECPAVRVTDAEYDEAKATLAKYAGATSQNADDMTSEGIAKGSAYVKCHFAQLIVDCHDNPMTEKRMEEMLSLHFDKELGIVSIPGEPFIEIQDALKAASPFKYTMVGAIGMGYIGYIGMPESYGRGGGYETRPSRTAPAHDLAPKIIAAGEKLLKA